MPPGSAAAHPSWFDPAMPAASASVLPALLRAAAARHPDKRLVRFADGGSWTYAEADRLSRQWAAGLAARGVGRGDPVVIWLPSGADNLLAWFAAARLGAVVVPLNLSYRGEILRHVLADSEARWLITTPQLAERVPFHALPKLAQLLLSGAGAADFAAPIASTALSALAGDAAAEPELAPEDIHAIIYTSGTTGPSKGVLCSYLHSFTLATVAHGYMGPDDVILVNMPLFHVTGLAAVYAALVRGAELVLLPGFSASSFWDDIRRFGCTTVSGMVGSVATFLAKNPPCGNDAENSLRLALVSPVDDNVKLLAARHGFDYFTAFGMSEAPLPIVGEINKGGQGECGRPRSGVECRIVDTQDREVADGQVGELVLRSLLPGSFFSGYHARPEATAAAWRDGWFHTGDAFRRDAGGRYYFVDRIKDAIRRRGENISSLEVEMQILAHPAVKDAAAVPVASEHGEEEILAVIELVEGASLDPAELIRFLEPRMAYFMIPRFVRTVAELPRTATNKVQKQILRAAGRTAECWDREAAGMIFRRETLRPS